MTDNTAFLKKINWQLFIVLFLMTGCFFTWSENIVITRGIKVVGRVGVLFATYAIYNRILEYGAVDTLKWKNILSPILYVGYLTLGFVSLLWSTDVGYSALQLFMTSQTLFFCYFFVKSIFLLDKYFPEHKTTYSNLLGDAVFYLMLIFVIGMWVNPDVFYRLTNGGEEARLGGYMMNPNELGMLSGLGVAGLIFDLYRKHQRVFTIIKILILFYALYETGSRSSLIGAFLIIGYHTGRLPFWTALINEGLPREPLFGFGFMRIDYTDSFQSANTYAGKMTHNTFMQVLINLGFVGLTIVIFQLAFTLKGIAKEDSNTKMMLYSCFIPLLINSFTEFGIFGESNYGILFYQLIIFYIVFEKNTRLTRQQKILLQKRRPDILID